jgi:hypothetical protein
MTEARRRGVKFGRKKKLTPTQIMKARKLIEAGEHVADVAVLWNVGWTTLYRALAGYPPDPYPWVLTAGLFQQSRLAFGGYRIVKKTLLGVGILALGCITSASATPGCLAGENLLAQYSANPTTAPSGSLVNGGGPVCSIGGELFTNFSYNLDAGSFPLSVTVEVATTVGNQAELEFDPNLAASSDLELEDQVVGATAGVDLSGSIAGSGFVNEVVCSIFTAAGICPTADTYAVLNVSSTGEVVTIGLAGSLCATGCSSSTAGGTASVQFASGASEVWIIKNINSGSAPFSEVEQSYQTGVPEPMTLSLVGAGLLGLSLMSRRRIGSSR